MKKVLFTVLIAASLFACKTKSTETAPKYPANARGYVLDSSANIELAKKVFNAFLDVDLPANNAFILANYADTAKIHDNAVIQTVAQNIESNRKLKAKGVKVTISEKPFIWETVFNEAAPNGQTSIVHCYIEYTVEKDGKKVKNTLHVTWDLVGDKIVGEWDMYDSAPVAEIFK
jgi:predicted ester cyclase